MCIWPCTPRTQAGMRHAVYTSSMSIYADNGLGRVGADEDTPPDASRVYGFTKWLGEEVCRNACREWGMSVNALRLYMPVPEDKWRTEAGKGLNRHLGRTAEDTARAILAALEFQAGFEAFTISGDYEQKTVESGEGKTVSELGASGTSLRVSRCRRKGGMDV